MDVSEFIEALEEHKQKFPYARIFVNGKPLGKVSINMATNGAFGWYIGTTGENATRIINLESDD